MSSSNIDKIINLAKEEVGYVEKKNGDLKYLYDKTANAGSANYTKYGYEMNKICPQTMDYPAPWCDAFVDYLFYKTFGESKAKRMLCGGFDDYTIASANLYKKSGMWFTEPKVGDQIFFKDSNGVICHTGIVTRVTGALVHTIEGNTSSVAGVVANGGCVREKFYTLSYSRIAGYGRPKYNISADFSLYIVVFQSWLNGKYKFNLDTDGVFGALTKKAAIKAFQTYLNKTYGFSLEVDGIFGAMSEKASTKCILRNGRKNDAVYILQGLLYANNIDCNGIDGIFGTGCERAVKEYQKKNGLTVDGIVGKNTWSSLFMK